MSDCIEKSECNGRREFLVKASVLAGGLLLNLSGASASAQDKTALPAAASDNIGKDAVLKIGADSPLAKVGGFDTLETKAGKVVVLRTAEMEFKAYSAVCPHKGGPIKYDEATKQLFCPWHNSRFDTTGKVVKGPAKTDLAAYKAEEAIVVSIG